MKWYLITEYNNPGDSWARMGCEQLILAADPEAKFRAVDKFSPEIHKPYEADRYVFCGQPMIWSHETHSTWMEYWWPAVSGWIADTGRLILAGIGTYAYFSEGRTVKLNSPGEVERIRNTLFNKCISVYTREALPCPSIFAGMKLDNPKDADLCNMMPEGAHDYGLCRDHAEVWRSKALMVAKTMKAAGFTFVSHSKTEDEYLERLNHDIGGMRIIKYSSPEGMLTLYSRCRRYFGNRIHGGIVARSFGADALVCGYDSRLAAVERVGGKTVLPCDLDIETLVCFLDSEPSKPLDIPDEFQTQLAFFR